MTDAHLPLTFSVASGDTLDTLEAVLAIARRGGLRLAAMQVAPCTDADQVYLDLRAGEPDLLTLFLARLHSLFCVSDIVIHERVESKCA